MAKRVSVKGKGADLFFGEIAAETPAAPVEEHALPASAPNAEPPPHDLAAGAPDGQHPAAVPGFTSGSTPRVQPASEPAIARASTLASTPASNDAIPDHAIIESIRKTVRVPGREVSFVRLTPEEKARLVDLVYTYKRQGMKTTENEINRIAVNYILADYQENGEHSILAMVLAALRA